MVLHVRTNVETTSLENMKRLPPNINLIITSGFYLR